MKKKTKKYCECTHKDPDYWCVCWFDGFQTADAEEGYNSKEKLKEQIEKEGMKSLRLGMLDFLSHGKRILNTRWGSIWWIKK